MQRERLSTQRVADRDDEWLDRLSTAIALGPSWDPGDGPLCDVVPIRSRQQGYF